MSQNTQLKACIFDLDGVLVDTAKYHYAAWKDLAKNWNIDLSLEQNEELKGVSRVESLRYILGLGNITLSDSEIEHWCNIKNDNYKLLMGHMDDSELLSNVKPLLNSLKQAGIKIGLGSASKNAHEILDKTGITHYFEAIVGGNEVTASKPDPEVFLTGANLLGIEPSNCIVFEDSLKGIEAAKRGKETMSSVPSIVSCCNYFS